MYKIHGVQSANTHLLVTAPTPRVSEAQLESSALQINLEQERSPGSAAAQVLHL